MKTLLYLVWLLWLAAPCSAQSVFANQTNAALRQVIDDYRSTEKRAFSWERELFTANEFDKAKAKFAELYQNLHNTIIKLEGEKPVILNGLYTAPERSGKHNVVSFHFLPVTGAIQRLKVELVLRQLSGNWTISLLVYEPTEVDFRLTSINLH